MCLYLFAPRPPILPDQVEGRLLWEACPSAPCQRQSPVRGKARRRGAGPGQEGLAEKQGSRTSTRVLGQVTQAVSSEVLMIVTLAS